MRNPAPIVLAVFLAIESIAFAGEVELKFPFLKFKPLKHWKCESKITMIRCTPESARLDRHAMLVIGARAAPAATTLKGLAHAPSDATGDPKKPRVLTSVTRTINSYRWIDSLQWGTQVEGFWTRELFTSSRTAGKEHLVFVTYILSKQLYEELAPVLEAFVRTLEILPPYQLSTLQVVRK